MEHVKTAHARHLAVAEQHDGRVWERNRSCGSQLSENKTQFGTEKGAAHNMWEKRFVWDELSLGTIPLLYKPAEVTVRYYCLTAPTLEDNYVGAWGIMRGSTELFLKSAVRP